MEAIVLAGGLGTRLRSVVPDLPKPLAPINGRPFLEYQLDYWIGQGVRRFVLSVGYKHGLIEKHFGDRYRTADIAYSVETEPLGTGGGLLLALTKLSAATQTFLAVNGDTFFAVDLQPLQDVHEKSAAAVTIALRRVAANQRYGKVDVDANGRISGFRSDADGKSAAINGGVYLMKRAELANLGLAPNRHISLEDEVFPALLNSGQLLHGFMSEGAFIDIGIPEDYRKAATLISSYR